MTYHRSSLTSEARNEYFNVFMSFTKFGKNESVHQQKDVTLTVKEQILPFKKYNRSLLLWTRIRVYQSESLCFFKKKKIIFHLYVEVL